jgi:hypothetical protein
MNDPFRDFLPDFPGQDRRAWAFNPFHPLPMMVVTGTMLLTALGHLLAGYLQR